MIVIDRAAIERSVAGDATDLLRFHAGLDLGRNGGPGQTTAVFIRGAESNHTLVLLDGVRINPGHTALLRTPRGPHSTAICRDNRLTPALAAL